LASAGEDTLVLLVSGDGMGPNYSGSHLLEHALQQSGDLAKAGSVDGAPAHGRPSVASRIRSMIPPGIRMAVSNALLSHQAQDRMSMRWKIAGIAWERTRAYVIENANEGYIRVNLKGREPLGIVETGAEYHALCDQICRTAATMTNPATGRPAALAVHKVDDM